jgi:hypothetical protein
MAAFSGSFAVMKKRALVTTTERPFAIASTGEAGAFLVQISNVLSWTTNVYQNNTLVTAGNGYRSGTVTRNLYNGDGNYTGVALPKVGYGTNSTDIAMYFANGFNAFDIAETVSSIGLNPYVSTPFYDSVPMNISFFNTPYLGQALKTINYPNGGLFTLTPEQLDANSESLSITVDPVKIMEIAVAHEYVHGLRNDVGTISVNPNESLAMSDEFDFARKTHDELTLWIYRTIHITGAMYTIHHGTTSIGGSYSSKTGSLHTTNSSFAAAGVPNGYTFGMYGSGVFINDIVNKYDTNNQLQRRVNVLLNKRTHEILDGAGISPITLLDGCPKVYQLAFDQALRELTTAQGSMKTYANVFVDEVIMSTMMRNNSSIPDKYKTSFPFWVWNRRASYWNDIKNGVSANDINNIVFSDAEEGRPSRYMRSGARRARLNFENDTIIPIWPKTGSVFSNALVKNALGSWAYVGGVNTNAETTFTYTSNTYISTPLSHQIEDLSAVTYTIPIVSDSSNLVYGTEHYVSSVQATVGRGDWVFKVVQFIPNGGAGTFIESTAVEVNVPGTYDPVADSWSDGTPQSVTINFTDFNRNCKGPDHGDGVKIWYFPRLVCVNRSNIDYTSLIGPERNVYSNKCLYTGHLTLQATIV